MSFFPCPSLLRSSFKAFKSRIFHQKRVNWTGKKENTLWRNTTIRLNNKKCRVKHEADRERDTQQNINKNGKSTQQTWQKLNKDKFLCSSGYRMCMCVCVWCLLGLWAKKRNRENKPREFNYLFGGLSYGYVIVVRLNTFPSSSLPSILAAAGFACFLTCDRACYTIDVSILHMSFSRRET